MTSAKLDLVKRLEAATGEDGACCLDDLRQDAEALRAQPAFPAALARVKALADANRLLAASLLRKRGEMCACEVQAALGLTHATVSHHMGVLTDAGIVTLERRGKWAYYALADSALPLIPES